MNLRMIISFLFVASLAYGRLGETEKQLVERFGDPVTRSKHFVSTQGKMRELGPALFFRQGDWMMQCDLVDGKCLRISYSHPGDWTEGQFQTVLNSNGQGAKWTENSKPSVAKLRREWKRTDGSTALWQKGQGMKVTWDAYNKA